MSMPSDFSDIEKVIRDIVFSTALPTDMFTWDIGDPTDASGNSVGNVLKQDSPFFLVETDISSVRRAGPGNDARRRVYGSVFLSYLTRDYANKIVALSELGRMASGFGDSTIGGIRFRQYQPTGNAALMGFMSYDSAIPFDLELRPMRG